MYVCNSSSSSDLITIDGNEQKKGYQRLTGEKHGRDEQEIMVLSCFAFVGKLHNNVHAPNEGSQSV